MLLFPGSSRDWGIPSSMRRVGEAGVVSAFGFGGEGIPRELSMLCVVLEGTASISK